MTVTLRTPGPHQSLGGSNSTSDEAQPLGQDICSLGLDEDLAAIQCHAGAQLPAHVKHGWFLEGRKEYDQVVTAESSRQREGRIKGSMAESQQLPRPHR